MRSDLDLLIVLRDSDKPVRDRLTDFLDCTTAYPTDVFPLTQAEIETCLAAGDHFLARALAEAIQIYPEPQGAPFGHERQS